GWSRTPEAVREKGVSGAELFAYPYHIHVSPVPANGNCTSTGGHLDPAKVKVADKPYNCDSKNAATTCELGDLAGRHGNITADASGEFTVKYTDSLISFSGANTILGHSVVIHAPDNSRLACANITTLKKGAEASSSEIESVASASALESAPAHSSKGSESDSANASIATGVESKKGSTASTAVVSGLAALIAAAFAL
ncbi:Superoxide dismutase, partial [Dipsacomyces acuminosporus]